MRFRDMRWPCDHPVLLFRGERGLAGRIRNISTGGARVELGEALEQGERLRLDLKGPAPVTAEVRWVRAGMAGLRFDRMLGARELTLVRKAGGTRTWARAQAPALRELH